MNAAIPAITSTAPPNTCRMAVSQTPRRPGSVVSAYQHARHHGIHTPKVQIFQNVDTQLVRLSARITTSSLSSRSVAISSGGAIEGVAVAADDIGATVLR